MSVLEARLCGTCGAALAPRKQRWCSPACKQRSTLTPEQVEAREARTCRFCTTPMAGRSRKAVICGEATCKRAYRAWSYQQNRDRELAHMKNWHAANRDVKVAYSAEWRSANPTYFSDYYSSHPDKGRLDMHKRRARLLANGVSLVTERDIRRLIDRYRGCCAYCSTYAAKLHLDHVVPIARGGSHSIGNLLPACERCNRSKGARLLSDWRRTLPTA